MESRTWSRARLRSGQPVENTWRRWTTGWQWWWGKSSGWSWREKRGDFADQTEENRSWVRILAWFVSLEVLVAWRTWTFQFTMRNSCMFCGYSKFLHSANFFFVDFGDGNWRQAEAWIVLVAGAHSGRGSNTQPSDWEADTLPPSYCRPFRVRDLHVQPTDRDLEHAFNCALIEC